MAEFGHIDILVNNAGLIRREDALAFSERLGRRDEPQHQERIFMSRRRRNTLSPRAAAEDH